MNLQSLSHHGDDFGDEGRGSDLLGKSVSVKVSSFSPTSPCKSPLKVDFYSCSFQLIFNFNVSFLTLRLSDKLQ